MRSLFLIAIPLGTCKKARPYEARSYYLTIQMMCACVCVHHIYIHIRTYTHTCAHSKTDRHGQTDTEHTGVNVILHNDGDQQVAIPSTPYYTQCNLST